jgi:hypothetical protein
MRIFSDGVAGGGRDLSGDLCGSSNSTDSTRLPATSDAFIGSDSDQGPGVVPVLPPSNDVGRPRRPVTEEMSRYIDLRAYQEAERCHAGWLPALRQIANTVAEFVRKLDRSQYPAIVIDHGCGPGTSLLTLASLVRDQTGDPRAVRFVGVDIDKHCVQLARNEIQRRGLQDWVSVMQGDSTKPIALETVFRAACGARGPVIPVSIFSGLSHLEDTQMDAFIAEVSAMLRASQYFFGSRSSSFFVDECLPPGKLADGLRREHGAIVYDALIRALDDDPYAQLAHLELDAWYSGLHKIGDFKRSTPSIESSLERARLHVLERRKLFPLPKDPTPTSRHRALAQTRSLFSLRLHGIEQAMKVQDLPRAHQLLSALAKEIQETRGQEKLHRPWSIRYACDKTPRLPALLPGESRNSDGTFPEDWGVILYQVEAKEPT